VRRRRANWLLAPETKKKRGIPKEPRKIRKMRVKTMLWVSFCNSHSWRIYGREAW
jgi:hypothetical protein